LLIREGKFGLSIKAKILSDIFVIEILFELVVFELSFLIPVPKFSFGGESILYCVIMHKLLIVRKNNKVL